MALQRRLNGYRLTSWERVVRAVLFVDIVESVRLFDVDEIGTFERWHSLLQQADEAILPGHGGRLVDIFGDGAVLAFRGADQAVAAAETIFAANAAANAGISPDRRLALRMGLAYTEVIDSHGKLYGSGVNLASRLLSLAHPGELVMTGAARERLSEPTRDTVEFLGDCFLKHKEVPVAAFRLRAAAKNRPPTRRAMGPLKVTLAIGQVGRPSGRDSTLHQLLSEIAATLAKSPNVDVVAAPMLEAETIDRGTVAAASKAGVDYVLGGVAHVGGDRPGAMVELVDVAGGHRVSRRRLDHDDTPATGVPSPLAAAVAAHVEQAIFGREWRRCRSAPLATQRAATLMIAARGLMFRLSPQALSAAGHLLEALVARSTREAVPQALRARWHVLRLWQCRRLDRQAEAQHAVRCARIASEVDPDNAMTQATLGYLQVHVNRDLQSAEEFYRRALCLDEDDAFSWLFLGTLYAFSDRGREAVECVRRARRNAPSDGSRHFFDAVAASAYLTNEDDGLAASLARRSLYHVPNHKSALRVLAAAEARLGHLDAARATVAKLMTLEPEFRASSYLKQAPSADFVCGRRIALALGEAGVPS